jgi:chorismate mutase-like protein
MSKPATTASLEELRAEIDRIDESLLRLLDQRMRACVAVAEIKRDNDIPMMAPERLSAVRTRSRDFAATHGHDADYLATVFDVITSESCRVEDQVIGGSNGKALGSRAVRIDHVAIAVRDLDSAISSLQERYGFELLKRRRVTGELSGMDSAIMRAGGVTFVLCQGDSPRSNVSQYIEHYGPGVQHIAIIVRGHEDLHTELNERGADLLTGIIHAPGQDQSFTRRESNTGVQLEFVTRSDHDGFHDDGQELFAVMERENVF